MNNAAPHVCMLAAENDVIPGAKVGGIGDVLRDIPAALAKAGATVSAMIPAYGLFHTLPGAVHIGTVTVPFMSHTEAIDLFEVYADRDAGVRYFVLEHALFGAGGPGRVYCDDGSDNPFATDATKFALFCTAALQVISDKLSGAVDVLHLHDWHTGIAAILRAYHPRYQHLQAMPCVFSIHNLALQGIRPLRGNDSSLESWFIDMHYDVDKVADPRWRDCVNPVAAAIRLSDKVHTVSPTYAQEIVLANDDARGFHGGEGLQNDLQHAAARGALAGIINGIDYQTPTATKKTWDALLDSIADTVLGWMGQSASIRGADYLAHQRCLAWQSKPTPAHVITSVGRLTSQKMALLLQQNEHGTTVLDTLLSELTDGVFILLGSGDRDLEQLCQQVAVRHSNFIYLNRYAQSLADYLFANGDVFLMPSSFEPCGISQMLAMRHSQPCLVHAVGGLRDTVEDNVDGFHFTGDSFESQATNMLARLQQIIVLRENDSATFKRIATAAGKKRFLWRDSAQQYLQQLYQ